MNANYKSQKFYRNVPQALMLQKGNKSPIPSHSLWKCPVEKYKKLAFSLVYYCPVILPHLLARFI